MPNAAPVHVACLCAAWCRLCDDYRAVLESLAEEFDRAGVPVHWHWVDIEDEAELVGEFDVETFPTIVVVDDVQVRFAGAVTPQREVLQRLLRSTVVDAATNTGWPDAALEVHAVAAGLRRRPPDRPARSSTA